MDDLKTQHGCGAQHLLKNAPVCNKQHPCASAGDVMRHRATTEMDRRLPIGCRFSMEMVKVDRQITSNFAAQIDTCPIGRGREIRKAQCFYLEHCTKCAIPKPAALLDRPAAFKRQDILQERSKHPGLFFLGGCFARFL